MTYLKLDYDGTVPADFNFRLHQTLQVIGVLYEWIRVDRTRRGYHVTVALPVVLNAYTVVCLQAILGSDPMRETYNLMRVRNLRNVPRFWRGRWNVLYTRHNREALKNG